MFSDNALINLLQITYEASRQSQTYCKLMNIGTFHSYIAKYSQKWWRPKENYFLWGWASILRSAGSQSIFVSIVTERYCMCSSIENFLTIIRLWCGYDAPLIASVTVSCLWHFFLLLTSVTITLHLLSEPLWNIYCKLFFMISSSFSFLCLLAFYFKRTGLVEAMTAICFHVIISIYNYIIGFYIL